MGYLYKQIAKEIWQQNPYIELHFNTNPVIWLSIHAHIYYKGEDLVYRLYIYKRPKRINTLFIVHVAHRVINDINIKLMNRKDF